MTNLDVAPAEVNCAGEPGRDVQVLTPREVPLGGPRAMTVRRTLPDRARSLIGGWCFADHYGPDDVAVSGGMRVPPHPHTGLQTVSWLFDGEIEHRDSLGSHAMVIPGELNLMTAGRGIAHSEMSTAATTVLRGVQLWVAQPDGARHGDPAFENYAPPLVEADGARLRVFIGELAGSASPVTVYSPLLGAEVLLSAGSDLELDVETGFEHGVLVDSGTVRVAAAGSGRSAAASDGAVVRSGELAYLPPGARRLALVADGSEPVRLVLLGGEPLGEQIVMWWNFIGRDHDEVAEFRRQWQDARASGFDGSGFDGVAAARFPAVPGWDATASLPAPVLPGGRLKPRG